MPAATYDDIADWNEQEFVPRRSGDALGVDVAVRDLLGAGHGPCLEIGCGTGVNAAAVRELGWSPVVFVHVGVHPCFCGGFADRGDLDAVVIRRGYLDGHWTTASWTDQGVRDKVGATRWPLAALLGMFLDAGLALEQFAGGGEPTPAVLAIRARRPS